MFRTDHVAGLDIEIIEEIFSLTNQTVYLFLDNVADAPDRVVALLKQAKTRRWPLVVIGSARTNEWNVKCEDLKSYVDEDLDLGYLSEFEIEDLLLRLEINDCLGHLASLSLEARKLKLRQEYGRQLLVALHEATKNASFKDIIRDEYDHIYPAEAKVLYLDVCALHRFRGARSGGAYSSGFTESRLIRSGTNSLSPSRKLSMCGKIQKGQVTGFTKPDTHSSLKLSIRKSFGQYQTGLTISCVLSESSTPLIPIIGRFCLSSFEHLHWRLHLPIRNLGERSMRRLSLPLEAMSGSYISGRSMRSSC